MKKLCILVFIGLLTVSFSACNNESTENSSSIQSTVQETANVTTTSDSNYKINIPYSCFESVSDNDCIVTGTDMKNGIKSKELSGNGGIIITVDKNKYDDLLEYAKSEFVNEVKMIDESNADIEKIEYSDNFDTVRFYFNHSYFYPETQPLNSNGGLPVVDAPATHKVITFGNIFKNSIYYQSLLKKTETELLTCKYSFIDSSDNSVVEEYVYPEK